MAEDGAVVVVGGTRAIGLEMVRHYAAQGREVVLTGEHQENVDAAVAEVGGSVRGIAFDLARPHRIKDFLADIGPDLGRRTTLINLVNELGTLLPVVVVVDDGSSWLRHQGVQIDLPANDADPSGTL